MILDPLINLEIVPHLLPDWLEAPYFNTWELKGLVGRDLISLRRRCLLDALFEPLEVRKGETVKERDRLGHQLLLLAQNLNSLLIEEAQVNGSLR